MENEVEIMQFLRGFFEEPFTSGSGVGGEEVLALIDGQVINYMNCCLVEEVKAEEVKTVVFQLGALEALGIDSYPRIFY